MGDVVVNYATGNRAVFSSVEEAHAQASHDLSYPGHADPVSVTVDGEDAGKIQPCRCVECEFQRQAPPMTGPERAALRVRLEDERRAGNRP